MVKEELGYDMPEFEEVVDYTEDELRNLYSEINDRLLNSKDEALYVNNTRCLWGTYEGVELIQLNGGNRLAVLFGSKGYDDEIFREIEKEFDKFYCVPYVVLRCAQDASRGKE